MSLEYRVEISSSARKYLSRLEVPTREKLMKRIRLLSKNPFAGDVKPLKGTKNTYRCRLGDYRIIFTIDKSIRFLAITAILPRGGAY